MDNVVGVVGWIVIIAAIVHYSGRRKAARAQQQAWVPRRASERREPGVHPDLGAGLALGHAITQMHQGDPGAAHLGHLATAAYWSGQFTDEASEDSTDDDFDNEMG